MKRRDFLVTAAGLTALPYLVRAQAQPCPPPELTVQGGGTALTACAGSTPAPPGEAPEWFLALPERTWSTIAGGSGQRIVDRLPSPVPHSEGFPDSPASITTAWTGGSVDQARGEYLLVGNGGHADYPGNEGYALALRTATPTWRRLSDPTPNSVIGTLTNEGNGSYSDGRPRAMHSTFQCYGDGRVWFALQNSVSSGGGGTINRVVAYNREGLGAGSSPLPYTSGMGPWETYGQIPNVGDLSSMIFGVSAFDRVGHKVWGLGGNSANLTRYWSIDTTGTRGTIKFYQANQSFGHWGGWVAVAHDLRILVAGDHLRNTITVLDLTKAGQAGDWTQVSNVTGSGYFAGGSGGAYVPASRSIAIGQPKSLGGSFYRLKIPTKVQNGTTVYDPAGQWQWSLINPGGAQMTAPNGNSGTYSKWQVVEDMGNGQSALVVVTDISGPTYVYRIPMTGL